MVPPNFEVIAAAHQTGACIRELTLAIEFLTTALRARVDGHSAQSHMVAEPLLFAYSKVSDMAKPYLTKNKAPG